MLPILTAVLSTIKPGTSEQSVLSVLLGLFFIKMYSFYLPYINDTDDIIAEVGQFQIFFTYFGALIQQNSLLTSSYNTAVGKYVIIYSSNVHNHDEYDLLLMIIIMMMIIMIMTVKQTYLSYYHY